jgi:hypothetical protein
MGLVNNLLQSNTIRPVGLNLSRDGLDLNSFNKGHPDSQEILDSFKNDISTSLDNIVALQPQFVLFSTWSRLRVSILTVSTRTS